MSAGRPISAKLVDRIFFLFDWGLRTFQEFFTYIEPIVFVGKNRRTRAKKQQQQQKKQQQQNKQQKKQTTKKNKTKKTKKQKHLTICLFYVFFASFQNLINDI